MRKSIYASLLVFFFISVSSLSAQIIVERSIGSSQNLVRVEPVFDKDDYFLYSDENNQKVYIKETYSNSGYGNDNVNEDVTLTINLDFNPDEYFPQTVYILDEQGYMNFGWWEGANPITVTVPAGQYDLIFHSLSYVSGPGQNSYVIKEQVDIQENMEMTLAPSEAQNYIQTNFVDEEGDNLRPEPWEDGVKAIPAFDQQVFFHPLDISIFVSYGAWFSTTEGEGNLWNFYVNDVSDRYSFIQSFSAVKHDGVFYAMKDDVINVVSGSLMLGNNPGNYVYHREKFQPSPMGEAAGNYLHAIKTMASWNGSILGGVQMVDANNEADLDQGTRIYIDNKLDNSPHQLLAAPSLADYVQEMGTSLLITGNPIVAEDNGEITYGSGASGMSIGSQLSAVYGLPVVLPFNPKFTFTKSDNPEIVQGDNAPLINVFAANYEWGGKRSEIYAQSIGRYGEVRENDLMAISVEIKYNGDPVYSGDVLGLSNFLWMWSAGNHPDGIFDVTMTSTNSKVHDLPGFSSAHMTYDWTNEDWTAPSVQRLQFRDISGKVTDRFISPAEGTVRLAAGDFGYDSFTATFNYQEGSSVEFYYSKYNQDEWTELELTKYPEHFFMPGFGDYYEASLASIQQQENENIWYDVKIISTDAAGNSQTQIVSPAFYIGDELSTNEILKTKTLIYPNPFTDIVNIQVPENISGNYTLSVIDLSGRIIHSESNRLNGKILTYDGTSLNPGIYILKIESNNDIIVERIIKK